MKRLIFILLFIIATLNLKSQISIYAGDSELKGLLGTELQYHRLSLSVGWRPNRYFLDDRVDSYSACITYYQPIEEKQFYLSIGMASKGLAHETNLILVTQPSMLAVLGVRAYPHLYFPKISNRWKTDTGIGINTHLPGKYPMTRITFDVLISYSIFNYKGIPTSLSH